MGAFFVYILKSSLCLAVFYLFYKVLLSKETFHRFNRMALLGLLFLSVVIPFCEITTKEPVVLQQQIMNLEALLKKVPVSEGNEWSSPLWLQYVLCLYLCGGLFCFWRVCYSFYRLFGVLIKGKRHSLADGLCLVVTEQSLSPFSWWKYIVISQSDLDESGEVILAHERAHSKAYHSLDLMISDVCILLHWFNPAAWLLKIELQSIHEYEADACVIRQSIPAKKYQLLLIKKAVGSQHFTSMTNSFNQSKLKKRITMMRKEKSNPWTRLKYLYVLPLTAIALAVFARPEISRELEKISSVGISEIAPVKEVIVPKVDKEPTVRVSKDTITQQTQLELERTRKEIERERREIERAQKEVEQVRPEIERAQRELEKVRPDMEQIQKEMSAIQPQIEKAVAAIQPAVLTVSRPGEIRFFLVDGKEVSHDEFTKLNPDHIQSMSIWKGEKAVKRFGEKAGHGVVEVTMKKKW